MTFLNNFAKTLGLSANIVNMSKQMKLTLLRNIRMGRSVFPKTSFLLILTERPYSAMHSYPAMRLSLARGLMITSTPRPSVMRMTPLAKEVSRLEKM
jgi:hypothetical protein